MLTASLSPTVSGKSVTLTCKTQLPPLRSDVKLWFRFFKDDQVLHLGSESFLKIPTLTTRSRDPPYYWCEAQRGSSGVCKQSQKSRLHVQSECQRVLIRQDPGTGQEPGGAAHQCLIVLLVNRSPAPPASSGLVLPPNQSLASPASCLLPKSPAWVCSGCMACTQKCILSQPWGLRVQDQGAVGWCLKRTLSILQLASFSPSPTWASFLCCHKSPGLT